MQGYSLRSQHLPKGSAIALTPPALSSKYEKKKGKPQTNKQKRQEAKLFYEKQEMVQNSFVPICEYLLKDFQKTQFYSSMDYSG